MSNEGKLGCEVVRDLLPNYIEGLTSEETKRQIEEHLVGCAPCNGTYNYMKAKMELEADHSTEKDQKGKRFLKKVRVKRALIILMIILLCCMLLAAGTSLMFNRRFVDSKAIHLKNIYQLSDDRIICAFTVDGLVPGQAWLEGSQRYDWPYYSSGRWEGVFEAEEQLSFVYTLSTVLFSEKQKGDTFYWEINEAKLREEAYNHLIRYEMRDIAEPPAPQLIKETLALSVCLENGPIVWWPSREDVKKVTVEEETQLLEQLSQYYRQNNQAEVMPLEEAWGATALPVQTRQPEKNEDMPVPEASLEP